MPCPAGASPHFPMSLPERGVQLCLHDHLHLETFTAIQKSCEPHLASITSSHKLTSTERSMKLLIVVWNGRKMIRMQCLLVSSSTQIPRGTLAVTSRHFTPASGWCAYEKFLDEDSGHENYSFLTSSCTVKMVWQMVKISLMVLWCLRNNQACLPVPLCCSKSALSWVKTIQSQNSYNHLVQNEVMISQLGDPKDNPCALWENGSNVSISFRSVLKALNTHEVV